MSIKLLTDRLKPPFFGFRYAFVGGNVADWSSVILRTSHPVRSIGPQRTLSFGEIMDNTHHDAFRDVELHVRCAQGKDGHAVHMVWNAKPKHLMAVQRTVERKNLSGSDILGPSSVVNGHNSEGPNTLWYVQPVRFCVYKGIAEIEWIHSGTNRFKNLKPFEDVEKGESVNSYVWEILLIYDSRWYIGTNPLSCDIKVGKLDLGKTWSLAASRPEQASK